MNRYLLFFVFHSVWTVFKCYRQLLKIPRFKKYDHEIKELLRALRFFLKSFYFFWGRIARYDGPKESRNLLKNVAIKRVKNNA